MYLILLILLCAVLGWKYGSILSWLAKVLGKKMQLKLKLKKWNLVSELSCIIGNVLHPSTQLMAMFVSGLRFRTTSSLKDKQGKTVPREKWKLVIAIQEVRVKVVYNHVDIDYDRFNMLGVDKVGSIANLAQNMMKIFEFYMSDKVKFEDHVQKSKKPLESSLEKLKKKLSIPQIFMKFIKNAVSVSVSRFIEFQVDHFTLEFDRKDQNPELDKGKQPKMSRYNQLFNSKDRRVNFRFEFQDVNAHLKHTESEQLSLTAFSPNCTVSNFNKYQQLREIAVGQRVLFTWEFPVCLNGAYMYLMSTFKVEIGQSEFFFKDDQMQLFFAFICSIRLVNNIRAFTKKSMLSEMGKFLPEGGLEDLYTFQNKEHVDTFLVPALPRKFNVYFQKTEWHLRFNRLDVEQLPYYKINQNRSFKVTIEHFSIHSTNPRIGKIAYPSSFEVNFEILISSIVGQYENKEKLFDIRNLKLMVQIKVWKLKGTPKHERLFRNLFATEKCEIFLNPATLLFWKFSTLFQTIYTNYNFAYYKELMTHLLHTIKQDCGGEITKDTNLAKYHNLEFMEQDLEHIRSELSLADKIRYFNPEQGFYDVTLIREKSFSNIVIVICNTSDEPLCIVRAANVNDKITESYPFKMLYERVFRLDGIQIQDINSLGDKDQVLGTLDEVVMHEVYDAQNDLESYNLRNLDVALPIELAGKLAMFAMNAKEQFGGLRLKQARWIPRRKMLRDNGSLKQDFVLKINVSNVKVVVNLTAEDFVMLKIGSAIKENYDEVEELVTQLEVSNLEVNYFTPKWEKESKDIDPILIIPKITLKKGFWLSRAKNSSETKTNVDSKASRSRLGSGKVEGLQGQQPRTKRGAHTPASHKGFRLLDAGFHEFVSNFYQLIQIESPAITVPFELQHITY